MLNFYIKELIGGSRIIQIFQWLTSVAMLRLKNTGVRIAYGAIVKRTNFSGLVYIGRNSIVNSSVIHAYTYIQRDCRICFAEIGRYCSIGQNVKTVVGTHIYEDEFSTSPIFFQKNNPLNLCVTDKNYNPYKWVGGAQGVAVLVGNDVWVGDNVLILEGVTIGDGAIVAAGAVVTKDIEPFSIVAGVPAKFVRFRFDEAEVNRLRSLQWWNLSPNEAQKQMRTPGSC